MKSRFAPLFALDPGIDYLNHGSFGACPREILDRRARLEEALEREPVQFLAREIGERIDRAVADLAAFAGSPPSDLAFVDNATTGVNTILRSVRLAPGDEILTTDHAYPACRNAMEDAAERSGARLVVAKVPFPIPGPDAVLSAVTGAVTARTRLAVLDHVTSVTALVFPIERLVAELEGQGVATLVDGAHALGMLPLDLARLGASYYTSNAHKWLCAPKGVAILYVRPDRQEGIRPLVISHGYGGTAGGRSRFRSEFDWVGTRDPSSWLVAPDALRLLAGLFPGGMSELMERNRALALAARRILLEALGIEPPCPESMIGSIASVPLPAFAPGAPGASLGSEALRDLLHDAYSMEVYFQEWPGPSGRLVRVAAQVYNDEEQYARLARALREVLGRGDAQGMTERRDGIRATLSTFDASMIAVSLVVGIGIFRTPAIVAAGTGTTSTFFLARILGGVVCVLGALTFAEIGSRLAVAGGYYRAVADCYHPALAFMLNWAGVLMQGAGAAGVAFLAAEHLVPLVLSPELRQGAAVPVTASILMIGLLLVNWAGIRAGATVLNALTILKIAMMLVLAGAAFLGPRAAGSPAPEDPGTGVAALAGALVAVLYTFGGAHGTINVGGDVRNARRKLPRAMLAGTAIVLFLYLALNAAYVHALGIEGVAASDLVAAELARARFGDSGHAVVSVAIVLSALGFVNATILHVPRSYYAMAQDRLLPRFFLRVNPKTEVQGGGLLFFGATMLLPALILGSFEKLLSYVVFTDALCLAVAASTIFVLRRRSRADGDAFRAPGYPVAPAIFVAALAGIAILLLASRTTLSLVGLAIFLSGLPIYATMRRLQRPRA